MLQGTLQSMYQHIESIVITHEKKIKLTVSTLVFMILPMLILVSNYSRETGFLSLIHFGAHFKDRALKDVRKIRPPINSDWGYDGQFYAQIALRPSLRDKNLQAALDLPSYRARRIGMPFIAYCLGFSKPAFVLQIYALLNFAFWGLLLVGLFLHIQWKGFKAFLLMASILWTTGTLISLSRALVDFPAFVLCLFAVWAQAKWIRSASILGIAGLFKETFILSMFSIVWPKETNNPSFKKLLLQCLLIILPFGLWYLYCQTHLPDNRLALPGNLAIPFTGITQKLYTAWIQLFYNFLSGSKTVKVSLMFEILCPLSILVQVAYLFRFARLSSGLWRMGICFAALALFLGTFVWQEQSAYTRVLLPLTASFNFLIYTYEMNIRYYIWYGLGNVGMGWMFLVTVF